MKATRKEKVRTSILIEMPYQQAQRLLKEINDLGWVEALTVPGYIDTLGYELEQAGVLTEEEEAEYA